MKGASDSASSLFCHIFIEGRRYKLFRRGNQEDGIWYIHFKREGRRYLRSLETTGKGEAQRRAVQLVKEVRARRWREEPDEAEIVKVATLGEVLAFYQANAHLHTKIKAVSVRRNAMLLINVVSQGLGCPKDTAPDLPSTVLTGKLVRNFKSALMTRYGGADADDTRQRKARITGNSMLRQGKSLFSERLLPAYADAGLVLPRSIKEFLNEPGFPADKLEYSPAPDAVIEATFEAAHRLVDENMTKAFWLAIGCGLRKGEISRARWEWFVMQNSEIWLSTNVIGKGGEQIKVPVMPDAWRRLEPFRKASGPVLEGSKTETGEGVFRKIGEWMTGLGWATDKKIHELRAYIASKIAEKYGLTAASAVLRHKDVKVTQQRYSRYFQLRGIAVPLG
ncbi:MAG TPA: site-specific integrase [Verrucomicrobiae bacterium]|nr:site-specific integrase [Verrucomicrobiae bacterium]